MLTVLILLFVTTQLRYAGKKFNLFFCAHLCFLILVLLSHLFLNGSLSVGSDSDNYFSALTAEDFRNEKFQYFSYLTNLIAWPFNNPNAAVIFHSLLVYFLWASLIKTVTFYRQLDVSALAIFFAMGLWLSAHYLRDGLISIGLFGFFIYFFIDHRKLSKLLAISYLTISVTLRPELVAIITVVVFIASLIALRKFNRLIGYTFLIAICFGVGFYLISNPPPALVKPYIARVLSTYNTAGVTAYSRNIALSDPGYLFAALERLIARLPTLFVSQNPIIVAYDTFYGRFSLTPLLAIFHVYFGFIFTFLLWPILIYKKINFSAKPLAAGSVWAIIFFFVYISVITTKYGGVQTRLLIPAMAIMFLNTVQPKEFFAHRVPKSFVFVGFAVVQLVWVGIWITSFSGSLGIR